MSKFGKTIASGLGTGYLPVAPGTWSSAVVVGLYVVVAFASGGGRAATTGAMAGVLVAASVACIALGRPCERWWGRKDPGRCVVDEWAGQALTLLWLPLGPAWYDWLAGAAAGFVAFRVFDIAKPFPAGRAQRLPAGWGILADDLAAGVYAAVTAYLVTLCALGRLF